MLHKKYCYDKAAPRTSGLYYSLRGLTASERDCVVAIHAFYQELEEILFECQDHQLVMIKFSWWHAEVLKLTVDTPEHPVLQFLLASVKHDNGSLAQLQEKLLAMIDGFEQAVVPEPFATFEEVTVHYMRTAGERELALQVVLQTQLATETLFQAMLVIELLHYMQHLRRYVRRGLIYFAADEMQSSGVSVEKLAALQTTPESQKLLQLQAEKIDRAGVAFMNGLTESEREKASHLMIRCQIAKAILAEIKNEEYSVLENYISLTPLRYWWIAWRT